MKLGANDTEGKNNVLNANKQSNRLHTAVSVAFREPSSVQRDKANTTLTYSFSGVIYRLIVIIIIMLPTATSPSLFSRTVGNHTLKLISADSS